MIYLDNNASTPLNAGVLEAMLPFFTEACGNPSSRHGPGRRARAAVEEARRQVAALINATPREIVFTSGATESNNMAIGGLLKHGTHVVLNPAEHKSVRDPILQLRTVGMIEVTSAPPNGVGIIPVENVMDAIRPDTSMVMVMMANNEVGAINDVAAIGALCREREVMFHVDASQAAAWLPIDVKAIGCSTMSLSGHKMFGPKGVGVLYYRRSRPRIRVSPLIYGGGQENGLRPGTLNVPAIVGMGEAAKLVSPERSERVRELRDRLQFALLEQVGHSHLVGPGSENRIPNNLMIRFKGVSAKELVLYLGDVVACSAGSACTEMQERASHVLRTMGVDEADALETVRFGIGEAHDAHDIDRAVALIVAAVNSIRHAAATPDPR